jgi:hypothetical protein
VPGRGLFVVLDVPASSTWWTYTPYLHPLTPLAESRRLRGRSLPAPGREDPDMLAAALAPRQPRPLLSASTSRSWAGRSRHVGSRSSTTTATTATQRQRSTGTVRPPPPRATLAAAHRLLNNPPSAHASPSAVEQWRHNIDQLIVAVSTPRTMRKGSRNRRQRIRAPPRLCAHSHLRAYR